MNGFTPGLIVGALVGGLAATLASHGPPLATTETAAQSAAVQSPARVPALASAREASASQPAPALQTPSPSCIEPSSINPRTAPDGLAPATSASLIPAVQNWSSVLKDPQLSSRMDQVCSDWFTYKGNQEEAALKAEPKDGQWAYSVEQLLQQYAASHRNASRYQITSIDCRTTYCEIRATGRLDLQANEAFQQMVSDAREEPWGEFSWRMGGGSEGVGDSLKMHQRIYRK